MRFSSLAAAVWVLACLPAPALPEARPDGAAKAIAVPAGTPAGKYSSEEQYKIYKMIIDSQKLFAEKRKTDALDLLRQAAAYDPSPYSANVHHSLGVMLEDMGEGKEALKEYESAATYSPKDPHLILLAAERNLRERQIVRAISWFEKIIYYYPDSPLARRIKKAIRNLRTAGLDANPNDLKAPDYLKFGLHKRLIVWPSGSFPLKVYIAPGDGTPGYQSRYRSYVTQALREWSEASNGKVSWKEVQAQADAKIVVEWVSSQNQFPATDGGSKAGLTEIALFGDDYAVLEKAKVSIWTSRLSDEEIRHTCLHEIGHALGLNHSPNPDDVLFFMVTRNPPTRLSARDKATLVKLYTEHPATRPLHRRPLKSAPERPSFVIE